MVAGSRQHYCGRKFIAKIGGWPLVPAYHHPGCAGHGVVYSFATGEASQSDGWNPSGLSVKRSSRPGLDRAHVSRFHYEDFFSRLAEPEDGPGAEVANRLRGGGAGI